MLQIERPLLNRRQLVGANLILLLVCLATAWSGFWMAPAGTLITIFWPPAGLLLAALYRYGRGLAPGAWLGAFLTSLLALLHQTPDEKRFAAVLAAVIIATGSLGALLLGKRLLESKSAPIKANRQVRQLTRIFLAGVIGSAVSAAACVLALYGTGVSPWSAVGEIGAISWISSCLGVFLFTPLVLVWWKRGWPRRGARSIEAVICLATLSAVTLWTFLLLAQRNFGGAPMSFLVLPFLTWAALRLGYRTTTLGLLILAIIAALSVKLGILPTGISNPNTALLLLAARLLCVIPTTLCIAAVVRERAEAESQLQLTNQNLEARIHRRTNSLRQLTEQLRGEVEHQKQTGAALRESQERLELAVRAANIGYWDSDLTTQTVHYSPEWKSQLGYAPEELSDHFGIWRKLLHPDDRDAAMAKVADYIEGRSPSYATEFRLRHKDGSYRWIYARGNLVRDREGNPVRLMGCHLDVTERKQTSLKLEAFALLGKQLGTATTVREAAQLIVAVADRLLGWDAALVVMLDQRAGLCRAVLDIDLIDGVKRDCLSVFHDKPPSPRMLRTIQFGAELELRQPPVVLPPDYKAFGDTKRPSASLMFVPIRDGEQFVALLSIQSYRTNAYTPADLATLQALADHGGGALARIRSREIQKESELNLAVAQLQAKLGSWEFNFETQKPLWSHGLFVLLDRDPAAGPMEFPEFIEHVYPPDRETVATVYGRLSEYTGKHHYEFRYQKSAQELRVLAVTLECLRDATGCPVKAVGVIQDITEQTAAERALRESGERLRLALDVAQMGTWDLDLTTRQIHADARLITMFAGSPEKQLVTAEEFRSCVVADDLPRLQQAVAEALARTSQFHERFRVRWPDQTIRWLEVQGSVFRDAEKQPLRIIGATVDVTERHQAEEALRRSEKQYAELVNNIDGIVWEADVKTLRMTFVSHQALNILGYPASAWVEQSTFWQDHIHPDDRESAISYCAARTSRGEDHSFEYRMIAADGRAVWLADFVSVIMEQGRPVTLRGVMVDITRRKELEQEQARSYSLLKTTLESSEDGWLVVDRAGTIQIFNQRFLELWRWNVASLAGRSYAALLGDLQDQLAQPEALVSNVQSLAAAPEQESFDVLTFQDGRIYERYSRPQRLGEEIVGRVWSFRDVTERRRNEQLLHGQTRILEGIAKGAPLVQTLTEICRTAEHSAGGMRCSVSLLDEAGKALRPGAAPSLPPAFWRAINHLPVGPQSCSCGTAAHRKATVIVEDIARDPLWANYQSLAAAHHLHACWSTPIFDVNRTVVGTLAFYDTTPKRPTPRERRIIEMATHTAAIAIAKHRADEQLAQSAQMLRQLSANLMEAHEAERRHLARELHDELGQTLTAIKILLESHRHDTAYLKLAGRTTAAPADDSRTSLDTAIEQVDTLLQQVRTLSLSLRPTILDDCGLPAALRWLLDQHTRTTGRPGTFLLKAYDYDGELEPAVETACFRIAQEALTNISRHSQARHVNVELHCEAGDLTLVVRDDGVGFDVSAVAERAHAGGSVGLLGQRERAALLGGRVDIQSQPGAGTEVRVTFSLPVSAAANIQNA